ncbi:MAG: HAD-IA family hydrolase [Acidobacteriota bacterium]
MSGVLEFTQGAKRSRFLMLKEKTAVNTVFFDAAGTLMGLRGTVGEIYGRYAEQFGFNNRRDESIHQQIERSFASAMRETEPLTFPGEMVDSIEELEKRWWGRLVGDTFSRLGPFPRIDEYFETVYEVFRTREVWQLEGQCREVLEELRDKEIKLGVISNFDSRLFDLLVDFNIEEFFDVVVISSHAPAAKPSPRIFEHALTKIDSQAEASIHVGDSLRGDYHAAQSAGLLALLYDPGDRYSSGAHERRISSLTEVSSFLV